MTKDCISKFSNNCVLVAFQQVMPELKSEDILRECQAHGFKGQGMALNEWITAAEALGMELKIKPVVAGHTLTTASKVYDKGTFLVRTKGHLLCLINGKIVDPNYRGRNGRRIVYDVFEVLNATHTKRTGALPSNPLMRFLHSPRGACKFNTSTYMRYTQAWMLAGSYDATKHGASRLEGIVRLNELTENTKYTRKDFRRDLRRGSVEIVEAGI